MGASTELERLATIPRGENDEIRISLDEYIDDQDKVHTYVNVRKWFLSKEGTHIPTKQGITFREGELRDVGRALKAALERMSGDGEASPGPSKPKASEPRQATGKRMVGSERRG